LWGDSGFGETADHGIRNGDGGSKLKLAWENLIDPGLVAVFDPHTNAKQFGPMQEEAQQEPRR
jgi:hypothetical protein